MKPKDLDLIDGILEYCTAASSAMDEFNVDYDSFMESLAIRAMCAFFVMQVGENANKLSEEFKAEHPEIAWPLVIGFRHRIVHGYKAVNEMILWDVLQNDFPELREFCKKVLADA